VVGGAYGMKLEVVNPDAERLEAKRKLGYSYWL